MGIDHNKKKDTKKKVKIPLKKPKVIDKIKTQSSKTTVSDAQKRSGQTKKSSKKTTVTDTQKRGQVGTRINLRVGKQGQKTNKKMSATEKKARALLLKRGYKNPTKAMIEKYSIVFDYPED